MKVMTAPGWRGRLYYHVTIPHEFGDALGLKRGDQMIARLENGKIVYEKVNENE